MAMPEVVTELTEGSRVILSPPPSLSFCCIAERRVIVPLLVPVADGLHIDLVHFGVVIMLNMMIGLALPPHGLLLFVVSSLTGTPLAAIYRETPIFLAALLVVLIATTFMPDIALTLPRLLGYAAR